MKLPNKVYDIIKYSLFTAVPALTALISGLGVLYDFNTTYIVGTIGLVATFIGALAGISNYNYKNFKDVEIGED